MKLHFIGIGGIGVSALAKYYLAKGWEVSGCDLVRSEITDQLKKLGVKIRIGKPQTSCVPPDTKKVIYSPAVPKTNPELHVSRFKFHASSYPEALGELTKTHYTIAVSGTHGKSTTTAMIGLLLAKAGLNPTVIVGTKLKEFGNSNFLMGGYPNPKYQIPNTKYLVVEADEHLASFLNYWPKMIVLTTIEADHLDYWKTLPNLLKGFQKYINHLPQDGTLVANKDDRNTQRVLNPKSKIQNPKIQFKIQNYSLQQQESKILRKILKIPGEYNVANALAALAAARILKIPDNVSFKALGQYRGSWRRFEVFRVKGHKSYVIVSDYGHHPTEVRVTVEAARQKWPKKTIWLVFQPHQYQRTFYLWNDFVKVLSRLPIDTLIITDIYDVAGREEKAIKQKVSSEKLVKEILNTKYQIPDTLYIPTLSEVEQYIKKNVQGGEIVMVMGAGDIYDLTVKMKSEKQKPKSKS